MKAAYATVFQVRDGICYGAFLSTGRRVEHESGIEGLARRLGLRNCANGMLISCDRDPERAFFFGTAHIDGEPHTVFELENRWSEARGKRANPSLAAVRRRIGVLQELLTLQDDALAKEATTQGYWDSDRFAITTRGAIGGAHLETLYLAALAGDLAPTYFDTGWAPRRDVLPDRHDGLSEIGPGLGLFAAGLAPPDVGTRIIEHQIKHGFKGRKFRLP
jgi:hypothetical protein